MPSGNDLFYVDNELDQLTRALACSSGHNFLAACEESAHGVLQDDLPTLPTPKVFPDPLQQLAHVGVDNTFDLSICERASCTSPKLHDVPPPAAHADCSPTCDCRSCVWLDDIFASNRRWAKGLSRINPNFFSDMAQEDTPSFLWIGCADSRVVPNRVTGLQPGSLYVHRNVGNVAKPCDPNCMSALEYSVNSLQVSHVVVCGHYGCSAVSAAMKDAAKTAGILNFWVSDIRQLKEQHQAELQALSHDQQVARLCELNVTRQVMNICNSKVVRAAWEQGQTVHVHGLIYDVKTGLLKRLVEPVSALTDDFAIRAAAEMQQENEHTAAAFTAAAQELLVTQGLTAGPTQLPADPTSMSNGSAAETLTKTAAAMQHRAPATSPPSSPRSSVVAGVESAIPPEELQALHEELAWVRSSEACALDAAQHLMEQTRALLREKQEMTQKMAEQAETIKWLEERLHFLESESEHLRAAAPTQLIKRFQELRDLPPDALTPDLLEEVQLLQGLMALGGQFSNFESPASTPHSSKLSASDWDKMSNFFPHRLDMHLHPMNVPSWNYALQDSPHVTDTLSRDPTKVQSKLDLLDQVSRSPKKIVCKAPDPDPAPAVPSTNATDVDKGAISSPLAGAEPDLWYLLGTYSPRGQSKLQQAGMSSPSSQSLPPSSIMSSSRDSGARSEAPSHTNRTSMDSSVQEVALDTKSVASSRGNMMSLDSRVFMSVAETKSVGELNGARTSLDSSPPTSEPVASPILALSPSHDADLASCGVEVPLSQAAAPQDETECAVEELLDQPVQEAVVSAEILFPALNEAESHIAEASSPTVPFHAGDELPEESDAAVKAIGTHAIGGDLAVVGVDEGERQPTTGDIPGASLAQAAADPAEVNDAASEASFLSSAWDLPQLPAWLQAATEKLHADSPKQPHSASVPTNPLDVGQSSGAVPLQMPAPSLAPKTISPDNASASRPAADGSPLSQAASSAAHMFSMPPVPEDMKVISGVEPMSSQLRGVTAPSGAMPPSPTSSRTATLPPLPPKRAPSSASGRSIRKRVVYKDQTTDAKQAGSHSRTRQESKRSNRSHSSRASVVSTSSCASERSSVDLGPTSCTAVALQRMAEELQQLEDSFYWEEDYDAMPAKQPVNEPRKETRRRNSKNTFGLHTSKRGSSGTGVAGRSKVTFASPLPTSSHHAAPALTPPLQAMGMMTAIHRHQPEKLSPIQEQAATSAYINYDADVDSQQLRQRDESPAVRTSAGDEKPVKPASQNVQKQKRRGGWLGVVARTTVAVAVGALVKRAV